jgi:DNA-binding FadR family transcriptional regulator
MAGKKALVRNARPTKLHRPEAIAGTLTRRIVGGQYPQGMRLPTERELAAEFNSTRNVVREALKRLEANGLVDIRHGSGIYAENPQFATGVELFDVLMTGEDGTVNALFLRDVLEFRAYVFRFMVQLAAVRHTDEELRHLRELLDERAAMRDDPERLNELSRQLFQEVARATHNQVCVLLFNTVERVSLEIRTLVDLPALGFEQSQQVFERILDAFAQRDSALAELVVLRYVQASARGVSTEAIRESFIFTAAACAGKAD